MGRLNEKVAVITGSTSGIGLACAQRFAQEGARVVVTGRRREAGEAAARDIGPAASFVRCDVTDEGEIVALVQASLDRFGRIDCVISNAGAGSATGSILETEAAQFDADFALHVRPAFLLMKHAAPDMIARGGGAFVLMSSVSGRTAGFNTFGYEVAKAALAHLARCAALELGERGVRVNAISPGPTQTGIFGKHLGQAEATAAANQRIEAAFARMLPSVQAVPGMVQPQDIAAAAVFLASDDARFVNGQDLAVDGGITAGRPAATMRAAWEALAHAASGAA